MNSIWAFHKKQNRSSSSKLLCTS
uniref:Uncharacterized protein n=1 Tax=Arundo donax TaxID=35708 RepID=A0A0A9HPG7_ARUDO